MKIIKCESCGIFNGHHTIDCKELTDDDKLKEYPRIVKEYLGNLDYIRSLQKRITKEITFWQGKFRIVAHENNMLRKKIEKYKLKNEINILSDKILKPMSEDDFKLRLKQNKN